MQPPEHAGHARLVVGIGDAAPRPRSLEHPDAGRCTSLLRVPVSGEAVSAALARQFRVARRQGRRCHAFTPTKIVWRGPPFFSRARTRDTDTAKP